MYVDVINNSFLIKIRGVFKKAYTQELEVLNVYFIDPELLQVST